MPVEHAASNRILALFAHPDDELSVGSTLARYAQAGVAVTLICATRGEAATIYSPPEYGATGENLGEVRTRELECCCQVLGINDLRWLDWPDGGVSTLDREMAVTEVVAIIRQVRPQVMLTHPDHGGYPHPDHLAVHDIALAAWQAAADRDYRPDLGPAHAVTKLYGRVIPMSFFLQAPEFAEYRVQLNGDQLPFVATPDEDVSTVLDVAAWADRRVAGWECHQSQHNPNGAFSQVPDDVQQDFRSREYLQLIAHRLADNPSPETDLFAGIVPDTEIKSSEPEADLPDGMNPGIQIEQDEPETPALRGKAADALAMRLLDAVRSNSTHVLLYQEYRKRSRQEDVIALLDMLIDGSQEAISLVSPMLRRLNRSPMRAGINENTLAQGSSRRGTASRLNFVLVAQERMVEWTAEQVRRNDPPEIKILWQQLADIADRHLQATKVMVAMAEDTAQEAENDD